MDEPDRTAPSLTNDELAARLRDVETRLRESEQHCAQLKANLAAIERSTAYQLSRAVTAHAGSVSQWPKIPVALGRFAFVRLTRGKRAASALVEPEALLQRAHRMALGSSYGAAVAFAEANAAPHQRGAVELLKANAAANDDAAWAGHLNAYLAQFGLSPVAVSPGSVGRLWRLTSNPGYAVGEGPLVTVIIAAFNAERTLAAAVGSIQNQTWKRLEIVLIDDASTDGTWAAMQTLATGDPRIKVLRNAVNVGPYVSKNRALGLVSGDYLTGHDADDWAHPQRIERQVKSITSQPGPAATWTSMLRMLEDGQVNQFSLVGKRSFDGAASVASITAMFPTPWFKDTLGAWDSVRFGADSELIERAKVLLGPAFRTDPIVSLFCLSSAGSLSFDGATGGTSDARADYGASWRRWHKSITASTARLAFPPASRPFEAPASMVVAPERIAGAGQS